ncbi:transcriptional regulator [Sphaerotilus hippei]|uniref:Transcriptional regulator n=1 Tax=Sphaerotilus hippei TaxID=744406 RepID=A0A318GVU3_9BURK|nr:LysR family transcriptional regulator [Sphaerotilus hippei]PXW93681.1 transcriptional regulator [Sphaerotilus hippei]
MNLLDAMRYLVALEQQRHFGRAAQACHITQPALSNALRALEARYGVTIVRRGRQYEGLTEEGERVLASAHRLLHECEALSQELCAAREQPGGRLVLGAVPTAIPVATRFAAHLHRRHPGLQPVVRSLSSPEIEQGIGSLSLDLAFGYVDRPGRQGDPGTARAAAPRVVAQYTEHYFFLTRAGADGAPAGGLAEPWRWREAARQPLCLLTREMHNRSIIDDAFVRAGAAVQPVMETNSVLALLLAVQSGELCSVVPGSLAALVLQHAGLALHPLIEPEQTTPVGLMVPALARLSLAQEAAIALAIGGDWRNEFSRPAA